MPEPRVIVIGGGAAGLSAAHELRKRGIPVLLLEASDRAGGRMAGEVVGDFYVDTGAQLFSTAYNAALAVAEELNVRFDRSPVSPIATVYNSRKQKTGVMNPSSFLHLDNVRTLLSFSLFSPRGLAQFVRFARLLRKRKDDFRSGDYLSLLDLDVEDTCAEWCRKHIGEEFLEEFGDFAVASITLSTPERIGALNGMMMLWMAFLERQHTLRMPECGMGYFSRRLAGVCEDVTRLVTPVERVVVSDGAVRGVVTPRDGFLEARAVICATTASAALGVLPRLPGRTRELLESVRYSCCCHVVFGVDRHPLPKGHYFFMLQRKGESLLDCFLDSTVGSPLSAPEGHGCIHAYPSEEASRQLIGLDDGEIKRRVLDEIRNYTPAMPEEPLFTRVYRWEEAVVLPDGGMMRRIESLRAGGFPGVRGLFLAGDYLHMLANVNGALMTGIRAADEADRYLQASSHSETSA
ncbi:NAD(P)/FAD-dependent oxidoreductase [Candidatus Palauibacter sp.]|uniref:NAD(P)/FAD-dependent oxidoreductase n=1 Tax=Candidatus Palauibacter sp. TaxID=3101350 RepID=UPI003B0281B1